MSIDLAYIFPNILPEDAVVFPLIRLFDRFAFLRPVEDDPPEADSPFLREMTKQQGERDRIIFPCPAPLAGERDRFLGLLRDIRLHPEEYAGHLGNLTAGLGSPGSSGSIASRDEDEHSIMATLLRQTGLQTGRKDNTHESGKGQGKNRASVLLWQARLLLKLGESLDRDQAEIRRNLDMMTRQQEELFRELREEDGEVDRDRSMPDVPTTGLDEEILFARQRLLLKAWARLFALSEEGDFAHTAFISASPDAVEALLEAYRTKYARTEQQALCLPLPMRCAGKDELLLRRDRFQEKAGALSAAIRAHIMRPSDGVFSEEEEAAWNDLLEQHYPAAKYGRCVLTLYFLPDARPQRLFAETFAAQDEPPGIPVNSAPEKSKKDSGIILGLLGRL